ncbi:ADP-ribosylglycohydrolase family protein [Embleya sp. NPDC005575]|uniref:ADP-ribosylglycohydrolase family protein n=1 Tax=Embleya sp. NPDC005575 TaxID=3156892 RepID=UPI0033ACF609
MVELAVADAYGAGFEYADRPFVVRGNTLAGYVQHPRHRDVPPGRYTDDTQMSIAVAEWLLGDDQGIPALADLFVRAYERDARAGYARGFRGVLEEVADGTELPEVLRPESDMSGAAGMDSTRAAITAPAAHTGTAALSKACVAYTGDVDRVATIALAVASCSAEYTQDLSPALPAGPANGP